MGENSRIEWTDHTFNPWIGCTKVSPGCAHCYAERDMDHRWGRVSWGAGNPRQRTSAANWRLPEQWNAKAAATGVRARVFCASLADVFDPEVPIEWLADLMVLIDSCKHLDWLLLTKRPEHIMDRLAEVSDIDGADEPFDTVWDFARHMPNVWLGTTVENQATADVRIPALLNIPARVRFLSCEPLLERVDLSRHLWLEWSDVADGWGLSPLRAARLLDGGTEPVGIHWVIAGGESGPAARPMHPTWARSLRDQCQAAGVPFLFKQWGEWFPRDQWEHNPDLILPDDCDAYRAGPDVCVIDGEPHHRVGKRAAGRLLDGRTWDDVPTALPA